jgi:hypothetical protein
MFDGGGSGMPWFQCFIRGENFPGQLIGESDPIGFYVTRFVETGDAESAESMALQALRSEPKLTPLLGHTPKPEARVFFEEIEELPEAQVPAVPPGFIFYPMAAGPDG